jgi:hypothetical protein
MKLLRYLLASLLLAAFVGFSSQSVHADGSFTPEALGVPDHIGYAVADLSATSGQLSAATGTQFSAAKTATVSVYLTGERKARKIALTTRTSLRGGPILELVQATPAVGPWAASAGHSSSYMSFAVENMLTASWPLVQAGFHLAAMGPDFSFWSSDSGVLIRLISASAAPVAGEHTSQAAIDLGAPAAFVYFPCHGSVAPQLAAVLGIEFRAPATFTFPWLFSDGTTPLISGTADISRPVGPYLVSETNQGADGAHGAPLEERCAETPAMTLMAFVAQDVAAAEAQVATAGLAFVGHVTAADLNAEYRAAGDVFLAVVSPVLVPTD